MEQTLEERVQDLVDREAIRQCMNRYCRGADRRDEEALRSAYWPDAHDRHGAFNGKSADFIDRAVSRTLLPAQRGIHFLGNSTIALHGDWAGVETYWFALQRSPNEMGELQEIFLSGRYLDRFERRNGEWRIADRVVSYEWLRELGTFTGTEADHFGLRQPQGARFPDDHVYELLRG